jgi:SNF2 family DNA or RNA helicase
MIRRYSSQRHHIGNLFLNEKLRDALAYDRIAGYFSSSLLEVAGEAIDSIQGQVRIVCNSDLDPRDVETARSADMAMRQEWCSKIDSIFNPELQSRFQQLHRLLSSGKLKVKVLPSEKFGLVHGKAGIITLANGIKTTFLGSTNETKSGWELNYELMWEDDSEDAVTWVQEEFDALWNHPGAVYLSEFIAEDSARLSKRKIVSFEKWKELKDEAGAVIESPVYRSEFGLWAHQKYFVKKVFDDHISGLGARFVLADMVGLGKTIQLALAAQLMVLHGDKPVLVIAPKTLLLQWQDELHNLLDLPSAIWDGKLWIDEQGLKYPSNGPKSIKNCPRRIGIMSQGLIVRGGEVAEHLLDISYECVIVDECHRARRKNLGTDKENEPAEPNNLLRFLHKIALKTKSMLLATATPVQLYPIEAYDLLDVLSQGNEFVLGNEFSSWRQNKRQIIQLVQGLEEPSKELFFMWDWLRNPLPPSDENQQLFGIIRRRLGFNETHKVVDGNEIEKLMPGDKRKIENAADTFFKDHNPFIRHIVRRTREFLETTIDPNTGEPYLKPILVKLFGEDEKEAIILPGYLKDAYETAESFSEELANRMKAGGFMRTMLLRRMGSSIRAGELTARKMLNEWDTLIEMDENDEMDLELEEEGLLELAERQLTPQGASRTLTKRERELLELLLQHLESNKERDPKYIELKKYLINRNWIDLGCIIFSQYFDTIWFMANELSKELPELEIGIYAGGNKSGIIKDQEFQPHLKDDIKKRVKEGKIKVLFGTDAASEGLNLQRLGTLINLDLPWNPTRLEQRKGRIQRIGQLRDEVYIYNMRYKDSVEDRVHQLLSDRLENIHLMFGQIPDILEDVWIEIAIGDKEEAKNIIDNLPTQHPFEMKYNKIENIDWESCSEVLNNIERKRVLKKGW